MRFDTDDDDRSTSLRQTWEFIYQVSEVAEAATRIAQYHAERTAWWETEGNTAEDYLNNKGFEYRERRHSLGEDVEIIGDPELAKRVSECKQKVREHKEQEKLYNTWVRALETVAERGKSHELKLTIDDIVFFGL